MDLHLSYPKKNDVFDYDSCKCEIFNNIVVDCIFNNNKKYRFMRYTFDKNDKDDKIN
jgi:hypothetical protein